MVNIFVSSPNDLKSEFEVVHVKFEAFLRAHAFKSMTLGRNAYSLNSPLDAVINLMGSCSGAIILGYPQYTFLTRISKGPHIELDKFMSFPTPWNQIEGALAYRLGLPILVIVHTGISGGIFDYGVLGRFILTANLEDPRWFHKKDKHAIFKLWEKEVGQYGKKTSFH